MIQIIEKEDKTFTFNVKTKNNIVLLQGDIFNSEEEIQTTLAPIEYVANKQHFFERKTATNGKFLFNLKNKDGKIIGKSQFYSSEAGMENGIKNTIKRFNNL